MCFTSAVIDQFNPYIPPITIPWPPNPYPMPAPQVSEDIDNKKLRELLDAFRQAYEAAAAFDRLTGQPDCVDPEKEKLQERVAELERRLDEIDQRTSALIASGIA